ncbi:hypothetical protein GLAREA_03094 [Glarea lozoyensis ATCC 20868]|uniref:Uncharacterized protein n=1 Tax=Glarea lozoyensis (strain ATCC 20868 / MF5171) TaxID=1116229 RepID=S3CN80_GLAL2|nr:uncharacterized protein GLAREA_03094 [Glarea lozoyensis ATCC 20868]EPE27180.1 hypothetical protein GLAREA_03094 [Glarea lozoyensis ATCC 20868]
MESKRAESGASKINPKDKIALESLNKEIDELRETNLPHIPHLLLVNTNNPFLPRFPHENTNTPFEPWEVQSLQYMTLIADADRGTALAKGNWEDEFLGPTSASADARSNTPTPNPFNKDAKKASVKYSIKDYKNMKQTGVKPSPKPLAADAERKISHSRNTSVLSTDTPMSRVPSMEGGLAGGKQNGVSSAVNSSRFEKGAREERPNEPRSVPQERKEKSRLSMNGNIDSTRRAPQSKETNISVSKNDQQRAAHLVKHGLPPRPQSPRRDKQATDSKKRPLESAVNPAEKRTKVDQLRPTAAPPNSSTRPRSDSKPFPTKAQKPQATSSQASNLTKKLGQNSKLADQTNSKTQSELPNSEKPHNLPPLLSPLPADLDNGPVSNVSSSGFAKSGKLDSAKNSSSNTPSKPKHLSQDTIVVKDSTLQTSPLSTPPKSKSPPFILPPLLSPGLPEIVEQELLRLQQKSAEQKTAALNTVEARHEKARQPDTPGVARKTIKSKVGHPPKKTNADSSKPQDLEKSGSSTKPSLIVKLPYKKASKKTIEQLLRLKAKPSADFIKLEAVRLGTQKNTPVVPSQDSDPEEDTPVATVPKAKAAPPPSKKRPAESSDVRAPDPPAKRKEKEKEREETPKPSATQLKPRFKSPAPTNPSDKSLLATPKRGDAMKSIAMRRVDSSDGHARTPQGTAISTPASAEKPRANGEVRVQSAEIERLHAEERRLTGLAIKVKHKMDDIMKFKDLKQRDNITDPERKLGLGIGLEALTVYMNAFNAQTRQLQLQKRPISSGSWESLIKLWEFMDGNCRAFPILQALAAALGALIREELRRSGVESISYMNREAKTLELLKANDRERDRLWIRYHSSRLVMAELGVTDVVGPWTTISEATNFAMDVLGAYSKKEKLNWKREVG